MQVVFCRCGGGGAAGGLLDSHSHDAKDTAYMTSFGVSTVVCMRVAFLCTRDYMHRSFKLRCTRIRILCMCIFDRGRHIHCAYPSKDNTTLAKIRLYFALVWETLFSVILAAQVQVLTDKSLLNQIPVFPQRLKARLLIKRRTEEKLVLAVLFTFFCVLLK